jgi:hypothetical protein
VTRDRVIAPLSVAADFYEEFLDGHAQTLNTKPASVKHSLRFCLRKPRAYHSPMQKVSFIGDNIALLLKAHRINAYDLQEKSKGKCPQSTTHAIVTLPERNIRNSTVKTYASFLGVTEQQLRGFSPIDWASFPGGKEVLEELGSSSNKHTDGEVNIPVGVGIFTINFHVPLIAWEDVSVENKESVQISSIATALPCGPRAWGLQIVGDMMSPRYLDGDYIIVDPDVEAKDKSDVIATRADGGVLFRTLRKTPEGSFLFPANDRYPTERLENGLIIVGVVRQLIRSVG